MFTIHHVPRARALLQAERGQGTVEYVGIVLAVAALLVAVAAAIDNKVGGPIATALVRRLQEAVTQVGNAKHGYRSGARGGPARPRSRRGALLRDELGSRLRRSMP